MENSIKCFITKGNKLTLKSLPSLNSNFLLEFTQIISDNAFLTFKFYKYLH